MSALKQKKETKPQVVRFLGQGSHYLRLRYPSPVSGYGACSVSGCNCRGYEGSSYTCENCGHNYDRHW